MKSLKELEERARAVIAGKSRSYVEDARDFAEAVLVLAPTNENLTAVQTRCTGLLLQLRVATLPRNTRQKRVVAWAQDTFGEIAMSLRERAMRFTEEAVELAQATGLSQEDVSAIVAHVFRKPAGLFDQEVGGVGVTLLALCEIADVSTDLAEVTEIVRVTALDREHFRQRQNVKADAGIAERVA